MDLFLCHLRVSELRKVHGQEGQDNFMPRWSLHTWAQEVEIPLWHPSTQH